MGVIADFEYTQSMLKILYCPGYQAKRIFEPYPGCYFCVPSGVTPVDERAVRETAMNAGAHEVIIMEEAMAAALGAGTACL
jgi:rod shape-determining protein MreB